MNCVVDASVAAKWFSGEEYSEEALGLLDEKYSLHAPDYFMLEMDSILCKWIRRKIVREKEARAVRETLKKLPIRKYPLAPLGDPAYEMAVRTGLSVYDCIYVALAAAIKGKVITADRKLYDVIAKGPLKKHMAWVGDLK